MEGMLALADREEWAASQFALADLGDKRRTKRLVKLAAMMGANSSGSIPQQTGGGADMKAAYRLFEAQDVTHAAICQPHFEQTRHAAGQIPMVFLVQDTMVLNFSSHKACVGLGPIGEGKGLMGLHQQNVLALDPIRRRPLGLMYQRHYSRTPRPKGWKANRKGPRAIPLEDRESHWWVAAIAAIGKAPPDIRWVHLGDRGEDLFVAYHEARKQHADWLIRVSQDRSVLTPAGQERLFPYVRSLPLRTEQKVSIRRASDVVEEVTLNIAAGQVTLRASRNEPQQRHFEPIPCWVVRVWETSPTAGNEPLEWILCTSLPCQDDAMLCFVAQGYALRWMIEEFHKCQKTGCQVEMRRLEDTHRLEPLIGLLSVLAVCLLQLKFVARDNPDTPASDLFDESRVGVMARYLKCSAATLSVSQFWRGIGRLGGHPGRKGDGPLGWLRAWRGWQSFQLIMLGAELTSAQEPEKCG
jgi:hypothetical protein